MSIPYLIYAPRYTHTSSGVRALHSLCDKLRDAGQKAELFIMGEGTPYSPDEVIAVYPDIVRGNPLATKKVVRWLLAPAGRYGGDAVFPKTDKVWSYTTPIARGIGNNNVMCLPTFDREIFYDSGRPREGDCFYAHKYDKIHGNTLLPVTDLAEGLRGLPAQIADTLRKSTMCYVYEMSEIIVLAGLCGCPVTLVRTPYFNEIPPDIDFDYSHVKWSDGEQVVTPNGKSVQQLEEIFPEQLQRFIEDTQSW